MILAIDESGNFSPKSKERHFHVGCHIRTKTIDDQSKKDQHDNWEKSVAKSCRENGEVKGCLLGEAEISTFVEKVILAKPAVRITVVELCPADNPLEAMAE